MSYRNFTIGLIISLICLLTITGTATGVKPTSVATLRDPDGDGGSTIRGPVLSVSDVAAQISPATASWELIWAHGTLAHVHGLSEGNVEYAGYMSDGLFVIQKPGNVYFVMPIPAPMITDGKGPVVKTMYIQFDNADNGCLVTQYYIMSGASLKATIITSDSNPGYNLRTLPLGWSTQKIILPSYIAFNDGGINIVPLINNPTSVNKVMGIDGAGAVLEYGP